MKNYTIFTSPYILIEDAKGKYQPVYKEYTKEIPSINLDSPVLCCPFSNARRSNKPKKKNPVKPGYCEICYLRYEDYLMHVNSKEHREYAEDDYNYRAIDLFIKDLLEQEIFGSSEYLHSPCEKLEAKYSSQPIHYNSDSQPGSLIRMSMGSCDSNDEIVEFDVILRKINQSKFNPH